ncbi:hypothetical protein FQA39_LY00280 [Lamprigera yunnana]|nr:hypothetical protein FQA39_LY00280 [Lamprigera yunnana]
MSDSDESDYIPDQEFESDISEPRFFGDWKVVSDTFIDSRDTDLFQQDYSYETHPAIVPTDMNSPKDCFEAFVSPKIVRELCSWTNIRAMMYFEEKHNYEMKVNGLKWREVTLPEMYIFMGLASLMGLTHMSRISHYWRKNFLLGGPPVFSSKIMSRNGYNRHIFIFITILKFLRFSNPRLAERSKPLTRLAMFFAHLRKNTMILGDMVKHAQLMSA